MYSLRRVWVNWELGRWKNYLGVTVGSGLRAKRLCLPNSRSVVHSRLGHLSHLCSFGRAHPARVSGHRTLVGSVFTRVNRKYCVRPPFCAGVNTKRVRFKGGVCYAFNMAVISSARVCMNTCAVFNPGMAITATKRPVLPRLHRGNCRCGTPIRVNAGY